MQRGRTTAGVGDRSPADWSAAPDVGVDAGRRAAGHRQHAGRPQPAGLPPGACCTLPCIGGSCIPQSTAPEADVAYCRHMSGMINAQSGACPQVCRQWRSAAGRSLGHLRAATPKLQLFVRLFPALVSLDLSSAAAGCFAAFALRMGASPAESTFVLQAAPTSATATCSCWLAAP